MSDLATNKNVRPVAFWGLSSDFPQWFPDRLMYLVSAGSLWWKSRNTFVRRVYPSPRTRMFLDSGGFKFFSQWGDYPFSPDDYLDLVQGPYRAYRPLVWASLDYPCEPEVKRSSGRWSNSERIAATTDNLAYLKSRQEWPGLLPVVQGYTLEERIFCLEELARHGLTQVYMAIGSLCACSSVKQIERMVTGLTFAASEILSHPVMWHLFGVKLSYFSSSPAALSNILSFDTAAWSFSTAYKSGKYATRNQMEDRFVAYQKKVETVFSQPFQRSLYEFVPAGKVPAGTN